MEETEEVLTAADLDVSGASAPKEKVIEGLPRDPYDTGTLNRMRQFFRKRAKKPSNYIFTAKGNLEIKDPHDTIQLKRFVPLDAEDRAKLEEYRTDTLSKLEEEYDTQLRSLRMAWHAYRDTGNMEPILSINERVREIDARRSAVRFMVRDIVSINNPVTNQILFDEKYEERKLFGAGDFFGKELMRLAFYDFEAKYDQGKYVVDDGKEEEEEEEELSELEYRKTLKDGRKARIFFDTQDDVNGFLSPMWPVDFTLGETKYCMAIQAYEAERMRELGKNELRAAILNTRNARTIRLQVRKITENPADAKGLWLKIITAIYQQTEALKERLLETETDALVYADEHKGPSGIGLAEKDPKVLDPTKWNGENALGVALETLRTQLREGSAEDAPTNKNVKEGTITKEQQAKAKVGAIINSKRKF